MFFLLVGGLISSCANTTKIAIPPKFSNEATEMHVKGLNSFFLHQKISFGNYSTTNIKKGWNVINTRTDKKSKVDKEERLLKIFGIGNETNTINQRNKFQYSMLDGNLKADVYCMEKLITEALVVKSNNFLLNMLSKTKNSRYTFSAAILPQTVANSEPWQMVLYSLYDSDKDSSRGVFSMPTKEEHGYATNGKDTISIKPFNINNFVKKDGADAKFPFPLRGGYELRMEDGVVGIIDQFGENIWIYNDLDANTKLILASISSAILLKKING